MGFINPISIELLIFGYISVLFSELRKALYIVSCWLRNMMVQTGLLERGEYFSFSVERDSQNSFVLPSVLTNFFFF